MSKWISWLLMISLGMLLLSAPAFGEEEYQVVTQDELFVGRMQLISSSRKILNSHQGSQKSFSYRLAVVPAEDQPVAVTDSKIVSGYSPYFMLYDASPNTCFYLSPPGSPDTPATEIVCVSDEMSSPCYLNFLPGYGGADSEYCLTVFSEKTKGYQPYTITGVWVS